MNDAMKIQGNKRMVSAQQGKPLKKESEEDLIAVKRCHITGLPLAPPTGLTLQNSETLDTSDEGSLYEKLA